MGTTSRDGREHQLPLVSSHRRLVCSTALLLLAHCAPPVPGADGGVDGLPLDEPLAREVANNASKWPVYALDTSDGGGVFDTLGAGDADPDGEVPTPDPVVLAMQNQDGTLDPGLSINTAGHGDVYNRLNRCVPGGNLSALQLSRCASILYGESTAGTAEASWGCRVLNEPTLRLAFADGLLANPNLERFCLTPGPNAEQLCAPYADASSSCPP